MSLIGNNAIEKFTTYVGLREKRWNAWLGDDVYYTKRKTLYGDHFDQNGYPFEHHDPTSVVRALGTHSDCDSSAMVRKTFLRMQNLSKTYFACKKPVLRR